MEREGVSPFGASQWKEANGREIAVVILMLNCALSEFLTVSGMQQYTSFVSGYSQVKSSLFHHSTRTHRYKAWTKPMPSSCSRSYTLPCGREYLASFKHALQELTALIFKHLFSSQSNCTLAFCKKRYKEIYITSLLPPVSEKESP